MWKCILTPPCLVVPSVELPYKCPPLQTFPDLCIVSLMHPATATGPRSQIRHFTWQATCYTILRVWNLVCCTKSDAESKRQDVAENCIMRKLATCPFPQTAVYLDQKTQSHLCRQIAQDSSSVPRAIANRTAEIAPPPCCNVQLVVRQRRRNRILFWGGLIKQACGHARRQEKYRKLREVCRQLAKVTAEGTKRRT